MIAGETQQMAILRCVFSYVFVSIAKWCNCHSKKPIIIYKKSFFNVFVPCVCFIESYFFANCKLFFRLRRSVVKMLVISMLIYFICYTPIQSESEIKDQPQRFRKFH